MARPSHDPISPHDLSRRIDGLRSLACRLIIGVLLVWIGPGVSLAQQGTLRPGDAAVRVDRIRFGVDTLVVLATPADGPEVVFQTITRSVQRFQEGGSDVIRIVEHHTAGGRSGLDTVKVAAGTLALRRLLFVSSDTSGQRVVEADLQVTGEKLEGRINPGDDLDRPAYLETTRLFTDLTAEVFTAALPISGDDRLRVLVLRVFDLRAREVDFVTEGAEQLQTASGRVDCFRVRAGGGPLLWIARDDGRLVRSQWQMPDGTVMWKLPKRDVGYHTGSVVQRRHQRDTTGLGSIPEQQE